MVGPGAAEDLAISAFANLENRKRGCMKILIGALLLTIVGCAGVSPPQWGINSEVAEAEYASYFGVGTGSLTGQAFLTQRGGGVVPPGKYYVRTEVTWEIGGYNPTQGGLVGQVVLVEGGKNKEVVLNQFTN